MIDVRELPKAQELMKEINWLASSNTGNQASSLWYCTYPTAARYQLTGSAILLWITRWLICDGYLYIFLSFFINVFSSTIITYVSKELVMFLFEHLFYDRSSFLLSDMYFVTQIWIKFILIISSLKVYFLTAKNALLEIKTKVGVCLPRFYIFC